MSSLVALFIELSKTKTNLNPPDPLPLLPSSPAVCSYHLCLSLSVHSTFSMFTLRVPLKTFALDLHSTLVGGGRGWGALVQK